MRRIKLIIQAFVTYVAIDIAYQVILGFPLMKHFVEASPLKDAYVEPTGIGMALMLIFFTIIAFANVVLAIEPAIDTGSAKTGFFRGAVLGTAAYATLGLTNGWSLGGFPVLFSITITLEGLLFSCITSGVTSWWVLRKTSAAHPAS